MQSCTQHTCLLKRLRPLCAELCTLACLHEPEQTIRVTLACINITYILRNGRGDKSQVFGRAKTNRDNPDEGCLEMKLQTSHTEMQVWKLWLWVGTLIKRWRLTFGASTVFDASAGNKHCRLSVKCDPLMKTHVQSKHRFRHLMWQESEQVLTRGEGPCLNQQQQLIIVYSCVPWELTFSTMFSSKHLKGCLRECMCVCWWS